MKPFTEKDGRKRRNTLLVSCAACEKEIVSRRDQVRKYCSKNCANEGSRVRVKVQCGYCNKKIERTRHVLSKSRSGLVFCSRKHKDLAQRLECGIREVQPPHYGTGKYNYQAIAYRSMRKVCAGCHYCEFENMLDVHHIDGNRDNNKLSNLVILCVFCHALITRGHAVMGSDKRIMKKTGP